MKKDTIVPNNPAPGNPPQSKIGTGHANAMFRQGLSELRATLYTGSNIAQQPEYGLYGHQTPGEIAAERKPDPSPTLDEEPSAQSSLPSINPTPSASAPSPLQQSMLEAESRAKTAEPTRDRTPDRDR